MKKIINLLLLVFLVVGCSNLPTVKDINDVFKADVSYKRDMIMTIDGKVYEGVAVIPFRPTGQYDFQVEARGDLNLFTMTTCAKHMSKESAWNVTTKVPGFLGWGERKITDKRKVTFQYSQNDLERRQEYCPMYLEGLDKFKGRHSQAFVDVIDPNHTLTGWMNCNDMTKDYPGVSACGHKMGKLIAMTFEQKVKVFNIFDPKNPDCPKAHVLGTKEDPITKLFKEEDFIGKQFEWRVGNNECEYIFDEYAPPFRKHRLTTVGHEEVAIREN